MCMGPIGIKALQLMQIDLSLSHLCRIELEGIV